jgi:hypothetical protein
VVLLCILELEQMLHWIASKTWISHKPAFICSK